MPALELRKLSKHFGAVEALSSVDLTLEAGQVLGLMGDNGAGKSTLVRIVAGNYRPSSGEIRVDGRRVVFRKPSDARDQGVEVVYQDLALCDNLSAARNIFLGRERVRGFGPLSFLDHQAMRRRAAELLSALRSDARPEQLARSLSGGQRQAVAIARTQLSEPRIVLLDEPTAAISVRQVEHVLGLIRRLKEAGIAVLLVSHRMRDIFAVCDHIAVLRQGIKVAELAVEETSAEEVTGVITGAIERLGVTTS